MKRDKVFTPNDKSKLERELQQKESLLESLKSKKRRRHAISRPDKSFKRSLVKRRSHSKNTTLTERTGNVHVKT